MNIQKYMDWKKLKDADMAALLECDKTTVWRLRTGKTYPSPEMIEKVHEITDGRVKANDFFHGGGK